MENAVEALKMAFAMLVLVLALSVSIMSFSAARQTADFVLQSADPTATYEYNAEGQENRIVGLETVIPTLYKYSIENYSIVFKQASANQVDKATGKLLVPYNEISPLTIYTTKTVRSTWPDDYINTTLNQDKNISVFDLKEEQERGESWTISSDAIKENLKNIIEGKGQNNEYANNPLTKRNNKYLELIGRSQVRKSGNNTVSKITITYVLIN